LDTTLECGLEENGITEGHIPRLSGIYGTAVQVSSVRKDGAITLPMVRTDDYVTVTGKVLEFLLIFRASAAVAVNIDNYGILRFISADACCGQRMGDKARNTI